MIDSKTMDAVIAMSEAQQDIATNSKVFKDNLKLISNKKASLNKASAELKAQRRSMEELRTANEESTGTLAAGLASLSKAQSKLEIDVGVFRTNKDAHNQAVANHRRIVAVHESAADTLAEETKAFDAKVADTTAALDGRDAALQLAEAKVNEILAVVNKVT
jgi:chromosome segregation ATPase